MPVITQRILLAVALALMAKAAPVAAQQSGWVGITYSVNSTIDREGNINFTEYPVVVSVDPGSPAANAGISAGDTIISFNSRDVIKFPVPLKSMLRPGSRFMFRYRRNDAPRTATIIVAERPANTRERMEMTIRSLEVPGDRNAVRTSVAPRGAGGPVGTLVRVPLPGAGLAFSTASTAFGGAEISVLNREMAEALGVQGQGVVIVNVVASSPARDAGLRGGDVVMKVDKVPVTTPMEFIHVVRASSDRSVVLEIIRKRKSEIVTLRW